MVKVWLLAIATSLFFHQDKASIEF